MNIETQTAERAAKPSGKSRGGWCWRGWGAEGPEERCQDGTALTDPGVCLSSSHLSISCPGQVRSPHSPSVKVLKIYGTWGILLSLGETLFSPPIH